MRWLTSFDDVCLIYVFISNGNEAAYRFYTAHGFVFSHDVLGGFIKAVSMVKNQDLPMMRTLK
jgi:hypothetical protein